MTGGSSLFSLFVLAPALLFAAHGDWRRRDIPNLLNLAIALAAPLYWWAAGFALWPDIAIIVGLAVGLFFLFAIAFSFGLMGGGDVKLIAALALWMTPMQLPEMLMVMALSGGLITIAVAIHHRATRRLGQPEIPYGIAISAGGLWVVLNEILTIGPVTA